MCKFVGYLLLNFSIALLAYPCTSARAESQCVVADPTATPLNVRTAPYGRILNTLQNGIGVKIIDHATDRYGKPWIYIADQDGHPLGWVFQDFIGCSKTDSMDRSQYIQLNCHMNECYWSALQSKLVISKTSNGSLVGATANECTTTHRNGNYPNKHTCPGSEVSVTQYVAFCSNRSPSIAVKTTEGHWHRTKLSISDDGQFGYNISSITMYLQICHDYVRGAESLDMIGAKFGYKSRMKEMPDDVDDEVDEISKLAE